MPSTSETGHAKNIANFQDLIAFVTGYGATYNPTKAALKLPNLQTKVDGEQAKLSAVVDKTTEYNNAVNDRFLAFDNLRNLSTRLVNALSTTDAEDKKIADAKGFNHKIQGKKAGATSAAPSLPTDPAPKTISSSQQSYDQLTQHLSGLVSVLQSEPSYAPNEADLKIATLTAKVTDMTKKNNVVGTKYAAISNARITRDKGLYTEKTGLVPIALEVKDYVKSVFGFKSPEYKQVSSIKFKMEKI